MSEAQQESTTPAPSPASAASLSVPRTRDTRWRAPVAALLVVLIFLGWQLLDTRNELRSLREDVERRLGAGEASYRDAGIAAHTAQELAQGMQARLGALENRMAEEAGQRAALEKLYQDTSRNRDERSLQDAEQAISIASQQLQLGGNVRAAIDALQTADASLAQADQGRTVALRRQLARDIERLKGLAQADLGGMSLQLEAMLGQVDSLPLAFARDAQPAPAAKPAIPRPAPRTGGRKAAVSSAPLAEPEQSASKGLLDPLLSVGQDFWQGFRQLVRVERLDRPEPGLLAPEQTFYLRENLRLRLLSARLALLQHDSRVFGEDVSQARQWMLRYFDANAKAVSSISEQLRQMESARLAVDLPDISDTLAAARRLRSVR